MDIKISKSWLILSGILIVLLNYISVIVLQHLLFSLDLSNPQNSDWISSFILASINLVLWLFLRKSSLAKVFLGIGMFLSAIAFFNLLLSSAQMQTIP